ncbi:hypothetical protein N7478_002383 [Penicillium angulare]|uniref:uncharacterized protein n=1 Tax=Penicillium angulare TaxID=116970 RepID=UPI00253F9E5C|nr:uncharacterized protein N7478_002383 [Penicillium angulare]KAJ5286697.1 hypothetical protein N7478_002383 [Penicillium angulare]
MASFMEELWSSIFTPGPTPTLLIATNVTFAALQLLFLVLLLATYSIHFVVLSFLSGGLWFSINWFAREVQAVQRAQEADKKAQAETASIGSDKNRKKDSVLDSADSETETENLVGQKKTSASALTTGSAASASQDAKKRISNGGDSSGYGSTDSEWEKVDQN